MDQQEVVGTVNFEVWDHPVLVIAEVWPSMAFAAQAVPWTSQLGASLNLLNLK